MSQIPFAAGRSFPVDAATQTFGVIGRKGSGKSYGADKLIEGLDAANVHWVEIDPVGRHFGLRLAADGKTPGLDVIILGGLRGDIPLDPNAGKLVADAFLDSGRNFILDVSQFSLGERKRFATAFGEQLWQRQKGYEDPQPVHVVLEEAQLFLPQQIFKGDEHMVGIWTEIVRLGRNCGIGVTLITQRPQSVAKEALTQVECLIVFQVNGVPEKKALKEWIVEKGADTNLLEELPFLPQGTAYIWSPQWLEHFGKHKVLPKWTFDSSATPKVGAKKVKVKLKPLDLTELKEKMAATVAKLEENDPRALKRKVAELEKKLSEPVKVGYKVAHTKVERVEVPVLSERDLKRLEKASDNLANQMVALQVSVDKQFRKAEKVVALAKKTLEQLKGNIVDNGELLFTGIAHHPGPRKVPGTLATHIIKPGPQTQLKREVVVGQLRANGEQTSTFKRVVPDGEVKLVGRARDMIQELVNRSAEGMTKQQLAVWVGMSVGGGFNNYLGDLRRAGLIERDGHGFRVTNEVMGAA